MRANKQLFDHLSKYINITLIDDKRLSLGSHQFYTQIFNPKTIVKTNALFGPDSKTLGSQKAIAVQLEMFINDFLLKFKNEYGVNVDRFQVSMVYGSDPKKFYHPSNFLKNLSNESTHIELTRHQEYGSPVCDLKYTNVATGQDLEWIDFDTKLNKDYFKKVIVDKSTSSQTLQTSKMSKEGKDTNWDDKYFYFTISSIDYTPRKESIEDSLKKTQDEFISKVDTINKLINSFEGNTKNWKSILQLEELNSKLNDIKNHLESIKTSK